MGPRLKRKTSTVRYTYSDDEQTEATGKTGGKKKKEVKLKTVVCKICHKKYTDRGCLSRHMETHRETRDYSCTICDASFKTSRYLGRHMQRVHGPATHECDFCGKRFTMASRMEQHRLLHTGEKPHKCEVCGKAFRATYSLNTHRLLHTNEKPYKCQYCPYACRDNSTLRKHHERHTGTMKWFQCSYCEKKCYSKALLKNHVAERHFAADLKVLPCPQCTTMFKTNAALNNHIKVVHERAYRAACEVCGLEISNRHNMAAHLRRHLRVRPYKCRECGRRFKDTSDLKKHSILHTPSAQTPCAVCGKLFSRRSRLRAHERTHSGAPGETVFCDHCGFGFENKPRLVRHMLKHARHRRTYACDVCRYVTHRRLSMRRHVRYGHGPEDDVHCKICDKNYKMHAYLILHYYNRHGVRYKTVKNIKMETSVTIKEEPQEPIPDAEVDLEEIQKQEPLADIITDVALDRDATDISYSRSVLNEDIRSSCGSQFVVPPSRFRRRLRGRAALFDEQNTLYARKEKDVKKRIKKLLTKVRQKKWARVLERARRQYNDRIRAMTKKKLDEENRLKIKYVNMKQDSKKTDGNDKDIKENVITISTENKIDKSDIRNGETDRNIVAKGIANVCDNETEEDADVVTNDDVLDDATDVDDVRNVYEDVLDIEENPVGSYVEDANENVDIGMKYSNNDEVNSSNDNDSSIAIEGNDIDHIEDVDQSRFDTDEGNGTSRDNIGVKYSDNDEVNSNNDNDEGITNEGNDIDKDEIEDVVNNLNKRNLDQDGVGKNGDDDENNKFGRGKNKRIKINTHQCYICYKLYETKEKLLDHCKEHFDICTDIPLKKCPICNYVTNLNITRHIKLVHGINITLPYNHINDKNKNSENASRYYYNINDDVVKQIEVIPSVKNLNKIAYIKIDKLNRKTKDMSVAKTKLVKKSGEWVIESEKLKLNNEFILPAFDVKEIQRLNHVGDSYLDVLKALGRLAKRHRAKMLYPCDGCEKFCTTFAALKLHTRRHEANPKPFRKKVWKHKLKGNEKKPVKTSNNRNKLATECVRQAEPRPIENKHKCDKKLMEFYEKNVKGADIEFWQFLKIYNRMNKDHGNNLQDLKETNEFGDYTTEANNAQIDNDTSHDNVTINKPKVNIRNKFTRKIVLSKEERLKRNEIKERLRKKNNNK